LHIRSSALGRNRSEKAISPQTRCGYGEMAMKWRVNILSLIAAILGVIALFSAWVEVRVFVWGADLNLIDVLNEAETGLLVAGCWLFIIGTLLSFLTPLGGILEILGVALFLSWFVSEADGDLPSGIGAYLGIASAIVAFVSISKPVGFGYGESAVGAKGRLLTFSKITTGESSAPTPRASPPSGP